LIDGLSQDEVEELSDQDREQWNAWVRAEAEEERERELLKACECYQARPDCPNLVPGHICGDCACQCTLCWDRRSARRKASAAGQCYCRLFWVANSHDVGVCGCDCPDCLARQEIFQEKDAKLWHAALLESYEEQAAQPKQPYPHGHIEWCECDDCAPVLKHNIAIDTAESHVLRERRWAREQAQREHERWLASPEGLAERARQAELEAARQAQRDEEDREWRRKIAAAREAALAEGPPGALAIERDPVGTYRAMIRWASCGDPDDLEKFGRLFLVSPGHHRPDALVYMKSLENCDSPLHQRCRALRPDLRHCDASCGSGFSLEKIKSAKQLDAILMREDIDAFCLPDEWDSWLGVRDHIRDDEKAQVWDAQDFTGCWRLDKVYELPRGWEETGVAWPGYDPERRFWFESPKEKPALPPARPAALPGQLAEISRGAGFEGFLPDLAALLSEVYGAQYTPQSLSAAVRKHWEALDGLGVSAGPTGQKDTKTRRAIWRVMAKHAEIGASGPSGSFAIDPACDDSRRI